MSKIVYLNGKYIKYNNAKISIEDRGLQFSDSVYEVIAYKNNNFIDIKFHLRRLKYSLKELKIKYSFTDFKLEKIIKNVVLKNKLKNGLIYLQITRGVQPRNHVYKNNLKPTIIIYIIEKKFNNNLKDLKCEKAITYPDLRWSRRDIKSVSLLANIIAAKEANIKHAYEAILIKNGYVTECTASNIWIIKNNKLLTHPANSDILGGITRKRLKIIINKYKLNLIEKKFTKYELYKADEVFLTSSSSFITPIIKIDNKVIKNGKVGKITYDLAKLYNLNL